MDTPRTQDHAYRAVTGVDLAVESVDVGRDDERYVQPSTHLRNRLEQQRTGGKLPAGNNRRALRPAHNSPVSDEAWSMLRDRNR